MYIIKWRERRKQCSVLRIVCILRSCDRAMKGVKTCVRLPCSNPIISHMSVCEVLKQSATVQVLNKSPLARVIN